MTREELYIVLDEKFRNIRDRYKRKIFSNEDARDRITGAYELYRDLLHFCECDVNRYVRDPSPMDEDVFITKENPDLREILAYRGFCVPIYFDDPGEQFYAILNNHEISGGSFNMDYIYEFMDAVDAVVFEEEYDWYLQDNQ